MRTRMRILTLCGSLRARSSNQAILQAYERLASAKMQFTHYDRLGALPHFNPDLDEESALAPEEVAALRSHIAGANAVIISTPEYAHALPGTFKNALDWLVSTPAFVGKPVVILHAARGSQWALDSLKEVLTTMSAKILEQASVLLPLGSNQMDADAILLHAELHSLLLRSIERLEKELPATPRH